MAEAHQAVAFNLAVTHEGVHINYDEEVLKLVFQSGLRSYRKRFARFVVRIKPISPSNFLHFASFGGGIQIFSPEMTTRLFLQNNFKTRVYPSSVEFLLCIVGLVIGTRVLLELDTSFGFIDWFETSILQL